MPATENLEFPHLDHILLKMSALQGYGFQDGLP
jgi:hypothetical protein